MRKQIEKIVLWRRNVAGVKEYDFKSDMVNVVTGDQQTGRTSFVDIVDYVFGATASGLPDKFNASTEWVGVMLGEEGEHHLFARMVPEGAKKSSGACHYSKYLSQLPPKVPSSIGENRKIDDVMRLLDELVCGHFKEHASIGKPLPRLNFRDVLNLNLQDDVTILSRTNLIRDFDIGYVRGKLLEYLPFILGIEKKELVELNNERQALEDEYGERTKLRLRLERVTKAWCADLRENLRRAQDIGLCDVTVKLPEASNSDALMVLARQVIEKNKGFKVPTLSEEAENRHVEETNRLQGLMQKYAEEADSVSEELERLNELNRRIQDYRKTAQKTRERIEVAQWVRTYWNPDAQQQRFLGYDWGSQQSRDDAKANIEKLAAALEAYRVSALDEDKYADFEIVYQRESERCKKLRKDRIRKHKDAAEALAALHAKHGEVRAYLASQADAYSLLGEIRSAINISNNLAGSELSLEGIEKLRSDIAAIELKIAAAKADAKSDFEKMEREISNIIRKRLAALFVSDDVKSDVPDLNLSRMELRFTNNARRIRHLNNIGASSNYLCFHIAVTCALHEVMARNDDSPICNFAIFDCPGQDESSDDADKPVKDKLHQLVAAIQESLPENGSRWQPIVLWQSAREVFKQGDQEGVHPVAHFGQGSGIIPTSWL